MVHCAAYNCLNDSRRNKGISLNKFPTEDHSGVCQVHFENECFELSPELRKSLGLDTLEKPYRCRLKHDAIPTIFDRGSPKAKCQVKGKQTFSKTEDQRQSHGKI